MRLINVWNDCHYAVQQVLSSRLLHKNAKKEYTEIYSYSSLWERKPSLTLKEEPKTRVVENGALGQILWLK